MSNTTENLKEAFAGESQANRKYLAFAQKAHQDGYEQVAKLFRAAAEAETIHALAHLRVLKGVKSTAENLKEADQRGELRAHLHVPRVHRAGPEGGQRRRGGAPSASPTRWRRYTRNCTRPRPVRSRVRRTSRPRSYTSARCAATSRRTRSRRSARCAALPADRSERSSEPLGPPGPVSLSL